MISHSDKTFRGEFLSADLINEVKGILHLGKEYPEIWSPVRGMNERLNEIFNKASYSLIPTVLSTTVIKKLDSNDSWYLKIYHHLKFKNKLIERFVPKAKRTFQTSRVFISMGLCTSEPLGWCYIKSLNKSLFIMREVEGLSLYDMLIRKKTDVDKKMLKLLSEHTLKEMLLSHSRGIYFGDLHLGHLYPRDDRLYFIDLDSVKFKKHLSIDEIARNLAGLNHPSLPVSKEEKLSFIYKYAQHMDINKEQLLLKKIKYYTKKRYK